MRILILLTLAATAACVSPNQAASEAPTTPAQIVADLDWLTGTWSGSMWGGTFTATYSAPVDGKLFSHSELFADGEVSFYEFEVFSSASGQVHMQPFPGGERVTGFNLANYDSANRRLTFANPDKDFPTQVIYTINADGKLDITLSDPQAATDQVEHFLLDPVSH